MDAIEELVEALRQRLRLCGYGDQTAGDIGGVDFVAVLHTAASAKRTFACAVARMPDDVRDADAAVAFVGRIRRGLAKRHAGFPWVKTVGTYNVLLCEHDLYGRLGGHEGRLIDFGALHVNVLLGVVLIDVETFQARSDTTWGLLDAADQFKHIQAAVDEWSRSCRRTRRLDRTTAQVLSVA